MNGVLQTYKLYVTYPGGEKKIKFDAQVTVLLFSLLLSMLLIIMQLIGKFESQPWGKFLVDIKSNEIN